MRCWRIDLQKKLPLYILGQLSPGSARKIEDHLADCDSCRERLARVSEGNKLMTGLPAVEPSGNSWDAIEAAISHLPQKTEKITHYRLRILGSATAIIGILILLLFWNPRFSKSQSRLATDRVTYREIPLAKFQDTSEPYVATVGYVADIEVDEGDGDRAFKLVDDLEQPNHFVVCEIIAPMNMKIPSPGSKIRVYGVSRYDAKADHQWFEVHPVLNIQSLR